mgnify:CR=1 FL=1
MSQIWGETRAAFGSSRKNGSSRDAHSQYQKKELELAEEREVLSRLLGDERRGKEDLTRVQRERDRKHVELSQLEQRELDQKRAVQDMEHRITAQKNRVSHLEREVNALREASFRRSE